MKTSVLIPAYNEAKTFPAVLEKLSALTLDMEVVAVDDGSSDGTLEWLRAAAGSGKYPFPVKVLAHDRNMGKGSALRTAMQAAEGEALVIQDADLEYDPSHIPALVEPIFSSGFEVVYGSRRLSGKSETYSRLYLLGNEFLTLLTNLLCGSRMTDSYTGYKAFKKDVAAGLGLKSRGFEVEAEISVKVAMRGFRFAEIPVVYRSRSREEGKKICWKDAFRGVLTIISVWFSELRRDSEKD
ncbi:MAG: glycosyltransferase family 2 protein [bacterium]